MNRLSDIIEMGGNLYEEAWNNGRREALKEVQNGKYEKLEEINRALQAQIDNYETIRRTKDEQIHRYEEQLNMLHEIRQNLEAENQETTEKLEKAQQENACLSAECDLLDKTAGNLRKRLEDAEAKIKEPTPTACPFCGGRPDVVAINKERWVVVCHSDTCAVNPETDAFDTAEEAVSAWNHRAGGLTCDWR